MVALPCVMAALGPGLQWRISGGREIHATLDSEFPIGGQPGSSPRRISDAIMVVAVRRRTKHRLTGRGCADTRSFSVVAHPGLVQVRSAG